MIKQLEAESTLVHELYSLLAVRLKALLGQWTKALVTSFGSEVDCMFDIVDKEKHCHTTGTFWECYGTVNEKWSRAVEQNTVDDFQHDGDQIWYSMQIINPNVKTELTQTPETNKHLFALTTPQHNISNPAEEFLEYQAGILKEIVELHFSGKRMCQTGPFFHVVHWIFWPFQYSV